MIIEMPGISPNRLSWFIWPLIIFILFRTALLIILYKFTSGIEFTSDLFVFRLALRPLSVVSFATDASLYSQPPLFSLLLAPIAKAVSLMTNEFLAPRISYGLVELLMFLVMGYLVGQSDEFAPKSKYAIMSILALSPLGFMTGIVMCQEEAIGALFVAIILLALRLGKLKSASFFTAMAIFTSKILFGILFFGLLLVARNRRQVFYWGIIPSLVIIITYSCAGYYKTGVMPFVDFSPTTIPFCVSAFRLGQFFFEMTGPFMKWASISLILLVLLSTWPLLNRTYRKDSTVIILYCLFVLYVLFYHINPEYYIFALPALAVTPYLPGFKFRPLWFNVLHFSLGIASWGYGIVFGLQTYVIGWSLATHSKARALEIYNRFAGFIPLHSMEIGLLIAAILLSFSITWIAFQHLRNRREA